MVYQEIDEYGKLVAKTGTPLKYNIKVIPDETYDLARDEVKMTNKEKLDRIIDIVFKYENRNHNLLSIKDVNDILECKKDILVNLDRLEKQDRVIKIIQDNLKEARKNRDEMENDDKYDKLAYEYNKGLISAYLTILNLLKEE